MISSNLTISRLFLLCTMMAISSCSSLRLTEVNFGWPVESVQTVGANNAIDEGRYSLTMRVAPLAAEEFHDSSALIGKSLHILRNNDGFYFVTGPQFKTVYVFKPGQGELILESRVQVSPTGLKNPAFNQRAPYVELLDGSGKLLLTKDEILERSNP